MRITDLTLPLKDGMEYCCTGGLPWETRFTTKSAIPPLPNMQAGSITLNCEPGTRFIAVAGKTVGDVLREELNGLILRDACKLHLPKEPKEGTNLITPQELDAAFAKCQAQPGDAIIMYTGHGDDEKYYKMGRRWETWGPCFSPEAIPTLVDHLKRLGSPMFGNDTCNISWQNSDRCSIRRDWGSREVRPEPDSPEAQAFINEYFASGKFRDDFGALMPLLSLIHRVGCVVNVGSIKSDRFKLIVAPLKAVEWRFVPASVFAVED